MKKNAGIAMAVTGLTPMVLIGVAGLFLMSLWNTVLFQQKPQIDPTLNSAVYQGSPLIANAAMNAAFQLSGNAGGVKGGQDWVNAWSAQRKNPFEDADFDVSELFKYWQSAHKAGEPAHNVQSEAFVRGVFHMFYQEFPFEVSSGSGYWNDFMGREGWLRIPTDGSLAPLPGDIMAFDGGDNGLGHLAIVVAVQKERLIVAQADYPSNISGTQAGVEGAPASLHLGAFPLLGGFNVDTGNLHLRGYIRNLMVQQWFGNASLALVRIHQGAHDQYASEAEWSRWSPSTCSTTSITEVLNAWGARLNGQPFRITNVLKLQEAGGWISSEAGLLGGFAAMPKIFDALNKAYHLDFTVKYGSDMSLDQVIDTANSGTPVIVDFPPDQSRFTFKGGHILVVVGGDDKNVRLADSSGWNYKVFSREHFLAWWSGRSYAIARPKNFLTFAGSGRMSQWAGVKMPTDLPRTAPRSSYVQIAMADARFYGLDPVFFLKQINQESGFNPGNASNNYHESSAGARGIAQFMPGTAAAWEVDYRDVNSALDGSARMMATQYCMHLGLQPAKGLDAHKMLNVKKYPQNMPYLQRCRTLSNTMPVTTVITAYAKTLADYNHGNSGSGANWANSMPCETRNYIKIIMGIDRTWYLLTGTKAPLDRC